MEGTAGDPSSGDAMWKTTSSIFIRGEGGWGGDRGPSGPRNVAPEREPDHTVTYATREDQALLYRLSGAVKIGRASCGERGCQYVLISVVAVSLQKKQDKYKKPIKY